MKSNEKGFTFVELLVAMSIIVILSGAASVSIFQVLKGTEHTNDYMAAVCQVQNAGYWISRDAQMAHRITTDNLTPPNFLILTWVERDQAGEVIYHSVTYFFEDLTGGIGKLMRGYWSDAGANEQNLIAEYIYYNPSDPGRTSKVSYQDPLLTLQLTSIVDEVRETREYQVNRRPNF